MTSTPPPAAPAPEPRPAGPRTPAAVLCLTMLVAYWPFSAVNGALAEVARSTGAAGAGLSWVSDAFAVAVAATVLPAGALAARHGATRVTRWGLVATATGAVVLLLGQSRTGTALPGVWAGQAVAGVGAGLAMTGSLVALAQLPADDAARSRRIAAWSAATVVGLGSGPFLVAAVRPVGAWSLVALPVAVAAVLLVAGLRNAPPAPATGGGGRVLALPLLRSARFDLASLSAAGVLLVTVAVVVLLGLFFDARGETPLGIAVRLFVFFAANAAAGFVGARWAAHVRPGALVVGGLALAAAGAAGLAGLDGTALAPVALRLVVLGAGCGLVMATSPAIAVGSAPRGLAPAAGGMSNALRQVGAAAGPPVAGTFLVGGVATSAAVHHAASAEAVLLLALAIACLPLLRRPRPA
ncbi:MFS transporter [Phycicoccus sonneratiae]|uniref:MFS transporter n=1 Tax=Phycicoccus sonneratiae TaxID=2807628 RepID=A0ABS2CGB0_9MICO|nr:MFS transporter [Phycicoccus sonneraticus]MBM6398815.1 MFS transporter [Phycicoccus sonneraticus]